MSLRLPINPGAVLYDERDDRLVVYSGYIVEDSLGQPAMFCHDRDWKENARVLKGVIFSVWLAKKYLSRIGEL